MIDVCLLGRGGGMPMIDRFLSAALINIKGRKILIDCGEGTQVAMRKVGWGFKSIDVILITHCHGDHIIGLPGLLGTIGNSGRTEPLTIVGPCGITRAVNGLRVIAEYLPYEVNVIENPSQLEFKITDEGIGLMSGSSLNKGEFILKALELDHSSPCVGYSLYFKRRRKFNVEAAVKNNVPKILWSRLQREENVTLDGITYDSSLVLGEERKGIKISFVTDTRPVNGIPDLIAGSDIFICEGMYGSDSDLHKAEKNRHMTFREAAGLAQKGNAKKLILTHFSPSMEKPEEYLCNAEEVFNNTVLAKDGMIENLNFID